MKVASLELPPRLAGSSEASESTLPSNPYCLHNLEAGPCGSCKLLELPENCEFYSPKFYLPSES